MDMAGDEGTTETTDVVGNGNAIKALAVVESDAKKVAVKKEKDVVEIRVSKVYRTEEPTAIDEKTKTVDGNGRFEETEVSTQKDVIYTDVDEGATTTEVLLWPPP